jgi:K(+)-stimulated pyrophosphate-energized sodium pump
MAQLIYIIPLFGLAALIYSLVKSRWITKQDTGTEKMRTISKHIQDGAIEFLKTEYKVLAIFVIAVAILLGASNLGRDDSSWLIAVSFLV